MEAKNCTIEGCGKPKIARGWCHTHYKRWQLYKDPTAFHGAPGKSLQAHCDVIGCDRPHQSGGLCKFHYNRKTHSIPLDLPEKGKPLTDKCIVNGCEDTPANMQKHCPLHLQRLRKGISLDKPKQWRSDGTPCPCGAQAVTLGVCHRCYDAITAHRRKERMRKHYEANKAYYKAKKQSRAHQQKLSTPRWLTEAQLKQMNEFYAKTPKGHEVDHILPINGEVVCGLHVPWNLQYLTVEENRRKSNKV